MANLSLSRAEAIALVNDLSTLIQAVDKDTGAILLSYSPQGMGVQ